MQLMQRLASIQGAPESKVVLLRPTTQSGMPPYFIVGCFGGGVSTLYPPPFRALGPSYLPK